MRALAVALVFVVAAPAFAADVTTMRVPDGGIEPQVVSSAGVVHLIYFKGEPMHGDIFYVHSDDGKKFSSPVRVNSEPGSAVAMGAVRGAHLAVGRNGHVHVAWNAAKGAAIFYARSNDVGDGFEPQRNLAGDHKGLDGGGSVAADSQGHVYVAWHAPEMKNGDEAMRRVWLTRSADDGKTFAAEKAISEPTGACACCSLRVQTDEKGDVYVLYRSATEMVHRDMYVLRSSDAGKTFSSVKLDEWKIGMCAMSTAAMTPAGDGVLAAWETRQQVFMGMLKADSVGATEKMAAPSKGENRKHPAVAMNSRGQMLLAWTEGTGWSKGGTVAWCLFDAAGDAMTKEPAKAAALPVWGWVAAFARGDDFVVVY